MADALPTSNLAPMFGDYVADYLGKGQALAGTEYMPYEGERFAGPSELQQQAFSGIGALSSPEYFNQAGELYSQAAGSMGGGYNPTAYSAPGYTAGQMTGPGGISALQVGPGLDASNMQTMQSFMNPYAQSVTDIARREAERSYGIDRTSRDAAAAKAGAFGGSRHGVLDAMALRDHAMNLNDIQMKGGDAAYRAAMDALNQQRASQQQASIANQNAGLDASKFNAGMQYNTGLQNMLAQNQAGQFNAGQNLEAQRLSDQSNQFGANYGLSSAGALSGIASGLGNLGSTQLGAQQGILNQQLGAGATQQAFNQQPLDFGYNQWQQSLQFPYQQLQFQQGLLQGLPLNVNSQPQSNALLEGLMGAGGIYNLLFGGD